MADNTTFQIITNESDAQKNDLPSGHATSARRQQTLNQDIVVKEENAKSKTSESKMTPVPMLHYERE